MPSYPRQELTGQEIAFCEAYLNNGMKDGKKAALEANYGPKGAAGAASVLLKKPLIREYIQKRRNGLVRQMQSTFDNKVKKLWRVAEVAIPEEEDLDIRQAKIGIDAIVELNKMQGHHAAEKHVNVNLNADAHIKELKELNQKYLDEFKRPY